MSTIEQSGILSKAFECPCGCVFKPEITDLKKTEQSGRIASFLCAIGFLSIADSFIECPECKKKMHLHVG